MSFVIRLSPSNTWIKTPGWLSAYVENVWLFLVGTVVFLSIKLVIIPPAVSMPNDKGVTSNNNKSSILDDLIPERIAAWTVAP